MSNSRGMRICSGDIDFLSNVGIFGILSTEDARRSYPDYKENSIHKRLRLMTDNGLIKAARLRVEFDRGADSGKGGRLPSLFSLTPAGADLLESMTGERPARVLNSDLAPSTYMHRREISEVVQIFTGSCLEAGLPMPRWVLEQDMWKGASAQLPPNQRRYLYHAMAVDGRRLICQPDIACYLQLPKTQVVIFWEIDRSTEGRKQLREAPKTDAYFTLMATKGFKRYWPDLPDEMHQFVFWVCPTPERLESLKTIYKDQGIADRLRFTHRKIFTRQQNVITARIWETINGELRQIYDPAVSTASEEKPHEELP